jgi:alpha-tubulin suppressor-like RCC1 family protein
MTCAISGGRPYCWGRNDRGQLGDGSTDRRVNPAPVKGLAKVDDIDAGLSHVCALEGSLARCWGAGNGGALGVPAPTCPKQPPGWMGLPGTNAPVATCAVTPSVAVPGLPPLGKAVAGLRSSAAVTQDGRVFTWGTGVLGQLGTGKDGEQPPTPLPVLSDVMDLGFGNQHACALTRPGQVYCWGSHRFGQIGRGPIGGRRPIPLAVGGANDGVALAVGAMSACVVTRKGQAKCWGSAPAAGTVTGIWRKPTVVPGLPEVKAMSVAWSNACALARDGSVWCWGYGTQGVVGIDGDRTATPTPLRWR